MSAKKLPRPTRKKTAKRLPGVSMPMPPEPIDVAAVTRRCIILRRNYTPDYSRRNAAARRSAHAIVRSDAWFAVERFAVEIERVTGRHVTPRFYRLAFAAVQARNLKRPNPREMQRHAYHVQRHVVEAEERFRAEKAAEVQS